MLDILINIVLFLSITISYVLIFQIIPQLPSMFIGFLFGIIQRIMKKPEWRKALKYLTIFEVWFGIIATGSYLFLHFKYRLWENPFWHLWSNPLLLFLLYIRAILGAGATRSENPILRRLSIWLWVSLFPILILMGVGLTVPSIIASWTLKWGIAASGTFVLLSTCLLGRSAPKNLEKFADLGKRQTEIRIRVDKLLHVVNVIGDTGELSDLLASVNELDTRYSIAQELLRKEKFLDAENCILQSEIEVNHIEENLQNRIDFSLKDEIKSKLEQTIIEIRQLYKEFELVAISTKQLEQLESDIKQHIAELEKKQFSSQNIVEYLSPIETLIKSISAIRVGLRLRKNVGAQLDKIQSEIEKDSIILMIASHLEVETQNIESNKNKILVLLDNLRNKQLSGAQELVDIYRELQSHLLKFRESVAVLRSTIFARWNYTEISPKKLFAITPKLATTDSSSIGLVILEATKENLEPINISVDGVLIELETDRKISIGQNATLDNSIASFSFVGKRAGKGKIIFSGQDISTKAFLSVTIIPTTMELARDSLFFAVPLGSLALIIMWGVGINVKD